MDEAAMCRLQKPRYCSMQQKIYVAHFATVINNWVVLTLFARWVDIYPFDSWFNDWNWLCLIGLIYIQQVMRWSFPEMHKVGIIGNFIQLPMKIKWI